MNVLSPGPSSNASDQERSHSLVAFTGVIPLVLATPFLIFRLYALGLGVGLVVAASVIVYHLRSGQGLTSLDVLALIVGVTNSTPYAGFHMTILIAHLDAAIYIVLLAQVALSLRRGQPWTLQFARRSTPRRLWATPAFVAANRFVTWVWGAAFLGYTLVALFVHGAPRIYVPSVVLLSLGMLTRRLGLWYARARGLVPTTSA